MLLSFPCEHSEGYRLQFVHFSVCAVVYKKFENVSQHSQFWKSRSGQSAPLSTREASLQSATCCRCCLEGRALDNQNLSQFSKSFPEEHN